MLAAVLEGALGRSVAPAAPWGIPILHIALLKEWLPLLLTPLLLVGWRYRRSLNRMLRLAYAGLLVATIIAFGCLCLLRARSNIVSPPLWDMQCYWMYGKAGLSGLNFYLPSTLHHVALELRAEEPPLGEAEDFTLEVLDVGFPYPPPSMLLFAPLGFFGLRVAAVIWYAALVTALAVCIVLLWRTFLRTEGALGLGLTAALVLTLRPTYSAFAFGQSTFLLLLLLILFWRSSERLGGGNALALAIVAKPVVAVLAAYTILRRHWRSLGSTVLTLGLLALAALALFGTDTFVTYFTANPIVHRGPAWTYASEMEQSLLGGLLRLTAEGSKQGNPIVLPFFVAAAVLILGFTLWLIPSLPRDEKKLGLALALPTALLIYPHSVEYYGLILIVPMLLLLTRGEELGLSRLFVAVFITAAYALSRYHSGHVLVLASLLTWTVLAAVGFRTLERRPAAVAPGTLRHT